MISLANGHTGYVTPFYFSRITVSSLSGLNTAVIILIVGRTLLKLCVVTPEDGMAIPEDQKRAELMTKIKTVIYKIAWPNVFIQSALAFLPLWMLADGHGVFYFQFCLNEIFMIIGLTMMAWCLDKRRDYFGSSSSPTVSQHKDSLSEVSLKTRQQSDKHQSDRRYSSDHVTLKVSNVDQVIRI